MNPLEAAASAHRAAMAAVWRALANECERDAERGVFHPTGRRCAVCLHTDDRGGCRLRMLADAA